MCGCFSYDLSFLVKLSLVFLPTCERLCKRAGAGQWLIFSVSLGANALSQPHGVTGPVIWAASGVSSILGSLCSTDSGGKGPCRTGLHSDSSVHDVTIINMDCFPSLRGQNTDTFQMCLECDAISASSLLPLWS